MDSDIQELIKNGKEYKERCIRDTRWGLKRVLGVELDECEQRLFDSAWQGGSKGLMRSAARVANDCGKTFTAACLILYFLFCFAPSTVIATSRTGRQAKGQLWAEVQEIYHNAPLFKAMQKLGIPFGEMQETQLKIAPKHFALHFSTDREARAEGWHNENLLFIMDEPKEVPQGIWNAMERLFRHREDGVYRIAAWGTPALRLAPFGGCFYGKRAKFWYPLHITAWESPRITDAVNQEALDSFGAKSALYLSMVMGEFIEDSEAMLIPASSISAAVDRKIEPKLGEVWDWQVGVDFSRFGENKTVAIIRHGPIVVETIERGKTSGVEAAALVAEIATAYPQAHILCDEAGLGGPIQDFIENAGVDVTGAMVGNPAIDSEHYINIRAEMFGLLAKRFEDGAISIPDDPELINQLAMLQKEWDNRLRLKLMGKDKMRSQGIPSPDKADSLALAFYEGHQFKLPVMVGG